MTEAQSAAGTRLAVLIGTTWTYFKEVKSVPAMGTSPATLDATHLESEAKEFIMDIPDQSDVLEFVMNSMPTGTTNSNYDLIQTLDPKNKYTFKVEYPTQGIRCTFDAHWNWSMGEATVSSVMNIHLSLVPASAPNFESIDNVYTVTYDENGGTVATAITDSTEYANGDTVTVKASTGFTAPSGKVFSHWNTKSDNSGTSYNPAGTFAIFRDTTLYAIWQASA